jgi:hypothetical protein
MTVSPRLCVVALVVAAAPAGCLSVAGTVRTDPPPAPPPASGFSSLRPGEVVPTRSYPADPKAPPAAPDADPLPVPPPTPDALLAAARGGDPGPFPVLPAPTADPPLLAAVRAYVENRPEEAIKHLEKLDRPNQEFALAVLPALARGAAMNHAAPDPQEAGIVAEQLTAAAAKLEAKAPLRIEKVVFCKSLDGFGRYEPWPETRPYRPGDLAVLYVEVRHLAGVPTKDGIRVRADVSLQVRDSGQKLVEQMDPDNPKRRVTAVAWAHDHVFRSPPRDYHLPYRLVVPATPGVYTITVEVREPGTGRVARSQPTQFLIAGP